MAASVSLPSCLRGERRAQRTGQPVWPRLFELALRKGPVENAQGRITDCLAGTYPRWDVIAPTIAALPVPAVAASCKCVR